MRTGPPGPAAQWGRGRFCTPPAPPPSFYVLAGPWHPAPCVDTPEISVVICRSVRENSLQDSLLAFSEVIHNHYLDRTDFILFLNKKDLFASKLKSSSISTCFPDYTGSQNVEASLKYIKEQFHQNKPENKQLYTHVCCALDVPSMKDLMATFLESILEMNIKKSKTY